MKLLKVDSLDEVKRKLEKYFLPIEKKQEALDLKSALGRYLAEDVFADINSPSFKRSVVDGYAVKASDTFGVSESIPVFLESVGTVRMGEDPGFALGAGETAYVPTGGMIPHGADAMVMVEHIDLLGENMVSINRPVAPNANLMNIGDDFHQGEKFFSKGHRITKKDIGLLAACGKVEVSVYIKPKLTVISTGDEIVPAKIKPDKCQIRDINSYAISAYAEDIGAEVIDISIVKDDAKIFREATEKALEKSDMVILSGGSSAGNMDFTAEVVKSLGSPGVITHGIAMKPGKPTIIGVFTDREEIKTVIGLPGHPLSAIMVFDVVVGSFLKTHYFGNEDMNRMAYARLTENIHAGEGRATYQLVSLRMGVGKGDKAAKEWLAEPIRGKSGAIAQLSKADGYVEIPAGSEGLNEGEIVEVVLLK